MMSWTTMALLEKPRIELAMVWGICSLTRTKLSTSAVTMRYMTSAVDLADFRMSLGRSLKEISRWMKRPTISPYTTATAADSVGVKMPA